MTTTSHLIPKISRGGGGVEEVSTRAGLLRIFSVSTLNCGRTPGWSSGRGGTGGGEGVGAGLGFEKGRGEGGGLSIPRGRSITGAGVEAML